MNPQLLVQQKLQKLEASMPFFHRLSPEQLEEHTQIPSVQWSSYLQQEEVRQRIHAKVSEDIEIAHRQALTALTREAQRGNVQAIRELNQLSGILNQNNIRQFITHYIPRPTDQDRPSTDTPKSKEVNT